MANIFISYGDDNFKESLIRIKKHAKSVGIFDKIITYTPKDLPPHIKSSPLFAFKNLKIDSIRALSEGKHLKLTLKDNNTIVNCIGFNMGSLVDEYRIGDKIDVVGVLEINSFNGVESLQINIKDVMRSL